MRITCELIKNFIEDYYECDLTTKDRTLESVNKRNYYYLLCDIYGRDATLSVIGKVINRNHATVIHGTKKIKDQINSSLTMYEDIGKSFTELEEAFKNKYLEFLNKPKNNMLSSKIEMLEHKLNNLLKKLDYEAII